MSLEMSVNAKIIQVNPISNIITIAFDEYPTTLVDIVLSESIDEFGNPQITSNYNARLQEGAKHEIAPMFKSDWFMRPIVKSVLESISKGE